MFNREFNQHFFKVKKQNKHQQKTTTQTFYTVVKQLKITLFLCGQQIKDITKQLFKEKISVSKRAKNMIVENN